jgi:hypothetical protein
VANKNNNNIASLNNPPWLPNDIRQTQAINFLQDRFANIEPRREVGRILTEGQIMGDDPINPFLIYNDDGNNNLVTSINNNRAQQINDNLAQQIINHDNENHATINQEPVNNQNANAGRRRNNRHSAPPPVNTNHGRIHRSSTTNQPAPDLSFVNHSRQLEIAAQQRRAGAFANRGGRSGANINRPNTNGQTNGRSGGPDRVHSRVPHNQAFSNVTSVPGRGGHTTTRNGTNQIRPYNPDTGPGRGGGITAGNGTNQISPSNPNTSIRPNQPPTNGSAPRPFIFINDSGANTTTTHGNNQINNPNTSVQPNQSNLNNITGRTQRPTGQTNVPLVKNTCNFFNDYYQRSWNLPPTDALLYHWDEVYQITFAADKDPRITGHPIRELIVLNTDFYDENNPDNIAILIQIYGTPQMHKEMEPYEIRIWQNQIIIYYIDITSRYTKQELIKAERDSGIRYKITRALHIILMDNNSTRDHIIAVCSFLEKDIDDSPILPRQQVNTDIL